MTRKEEIDIVVQTILFDIHNMTSNVFHLDDIQTEELIKKISKLSADLEKYLIELKEIRYDEHK